jgi:hypothetical protein
MIRSGFAKFYSRLPERNTNTKMNAVQSELLPPGSDGLRCRAIEDEILITKRF